MSKVNAYLKRGFIILTCLIGLTSGLGLGFTLFGHGYFHSTDDIEDMIVVIKVLYALATVTFLLAAIGVYGATTDRSWPLIIFSVGMCLTILFLSFDLVAILIFKNQALELVEKEHREYWVTPLDSTNATNLETLHEVQENLKCCGVEVGYQDWGYDIHMTCVCSEDDTGCIPAPMNSSLYENQSAKPGGQTIMIHKPPCLPLLVGYMKFALEIMIAILATVVIFWSASLLLAILILVQLRREVEVPPVYYSAEAKAGNYASLAENAEL